jgi:polyisoprenoid-binding protein YceI
MSRALIASLSALLLVTASAAGAAPSADPAAAPAGHYELDARHTSVTASVLHMGISNFTMRIKGVQGSFDFDPASPLASRIQVTLDARSLDAGDPGVSKTFAGEFLDAEKNPTITFASTAIQQTTPGHGVITGNLTFRGVTRPVVLEVAYNGYASSLILGRKMGFSATTVIKRSEFGSRAWQNAVADEVRLVIETEFARK